MSVDAIVQVLLIAWMAALALLLVRMLWLGLHQQYLFFVISTGLGLVFGVATLQSGLASRGAQSLGLLGNTMDIFLAPAIAIELFSPPDRRAASSGRSMSPLILMVLAAGATVLYLSSSPDTDSFQSAATVAFLADTLVTLLVLSFVMRRYRHKELVDRNTLWLRRLFTFELVMSALQSLIASLIAPFIAASQFGFIDIGLFSVSLIANAICTFALRRVPPETAKA